MIGALNRLGVEVRRGLSQFAVGSKEPSLGFDFIDNTYLADGTKNLSQAITHSRSGNATMTDGYGPELVTNGTFDSDTGWTLTGSATISDGQLVFSGGASGTAVFDLTANQDKAYIVKVRKPVEGVSGGANASLKFRNSVGGTTGSINLGGVNGPKTFEEIILPSDDTVDIEISYNGGGSYEYAFDDVSVREMPAIKWAPHNLTPNSEDFSGSTLLGTGTTYTSNQATTPSGSPAGRLSNPTTAGSIRSVGPNSVSGQRRSLALTFKVVSGDGDLTFGSTSRETFTIDISTLAITEYNPAGWVNDGTELTNLGDGWYRVESSEIPASSLETRIQVENSTGFEILISEASSYRSDLGGMVDNPERGDSYVPTAVRPFGPELVTNGTFDTDTSGWTITDDADGGWVSGAVQFGREPANIDALLAQLITVETGKVYEVSFDIVSTTGGFLSVRDGLGILLDLTSTTTGSFKTVHYANDTSFNLTFTHRTQGGSITLDNISVRESSVDPSAARYLPRVGHHVYNGDAWVNEGLLHESEARTNLITYSEDFTDAYWGKNNTATLAVDAVGPDGQTSAVTLVDSGATGTGSVYALSSSVTVSTSSKYTFSVYMKADQLTWARMAASNFTTPSNSSSFFDLENGVTGILSAAHDSSSIEDVGNGWYRCSVTFTTDATDTTGQLAVALAGGDGDTTVDLDGTSSVLIYGAQFEAGSTPSSYIPTAGATVTRAAETLTVPAANLPWPYPEVIGDELVTDALLDAGGYWDNNSAGVTVGGGEAVWSSATSGSRLASSSLNAVASTQYLVSFEIKTITAGALRLADALGNALSADFSTSGVKTFVAQCPASAGFFLRAVGTTTAAVENYSIREINPLSVSIQMDGRMTYADTDENTAVKFFEWEASAGNAIQTQLRTVSTYEGAVQFDQSDSSVFDNVIDADAYSPGVLVPYNIASRHGSAFVNGAVDGVALTSNTTPVALPDLSSTDLNLGYDYMGTINQFRVWSQDLGDTGIVEATEPSLEPSLSLTFDSTDSSFIVRDFT